MPSMGLLSKTSILLIGRWRAIKVSRSLITLASVVKYRRTRSRSQHTWRVIMIYPSLDRIYRINRIWSKDYAWA